MADRTAGDRSGVQVLARAAAVLRAVAEQPSGLSLSEIATRLGLPRSTIQRIVGALVEESFLVSAGLRAGVTLGPALTRLAAAVVIDTEQLVRPVLRSLSADLGETVDLSVMRQGRAVFVDQVLGSSRLVAASAIGATFPLHCTANGKSLLALLPLGRREALLAGPIEQCTVNTVTDRAALAAIIDEVARVGIAWDIEEHAEGVCAIGASFTNRMGQPFSISVPVPSGRFQSKRELLEARLKAAIAEVAALNI